MSLDKRRSLLAERTTLRTWLTAIIVAMVGIGFLALGDFSFGVNLGTWQVVQDVVKDIGGLLLASVAITLLLELGGKRAFLDELLSKVHLSEEVKSAGIIWVSEDFQNVERDTWDTLFRTANKVDIFFGYGRSWRNTHNERLKALAARDDARIRVIMPDPDDELTMADLARRFGYSPDQLRSHIRETEDYFQKLRPRYTTKGAKISLWFLRATPLFSFYRFDDKVVLTFYSHRHELVPVPTFILEKRGKMFNFVRDDLDAIMGKESDLARLAWERGS